MKPVIFAAAALAALTAACDSSPEVDVRNADAGEVAEAVRKSGVGGGDDFQVRPGKWESKVAIEEIDIPGMPAGMQDQMKKTFAERQPASFTSCLTAADARKPKEDFFAGKDNKCRYDHFRMGDGKIDAKMRCDAGEAAQVMEMAGTYSPDSYTMTMTTVREGGAGPGGAARMTMRMDAKRVGECDQPAG
jgi:hypothetical protein